MRADRKVDGYSRDLQAARLRASYQRAYFAPALFNLVPVKTDLIASMAVDAYWRLYYNESWMATHTVEENAALLIHEVGHLLRDHEARKKAAAAQNARLWNTAADCEINDDLVAEGLPLPEDPPQPGKYGLPTGETAELYYRKLSEPKAGSTRECDPSTLRQAQGRPSKVEGDRLRVVPSGVERRLRLRRARRSTAWELPPEEETSGGTPGVDAVKAEMVRRDVAQRIMDISGFSGEVSLGWRRWAHGVMTPKVDYLAIIRRTVRHGPPGEHARPLRSHLSPAASAAGLLRRVHHAVVLPASARPGFLIDTSSSMQNAQLSRAIDRAGLAHAAARLCQ